MVRDGARIRGVIQQRVQRVQALDAQRLARLQPVRGRAAELSEDLLETIKPISKVMHKEEIMIAQSKFAIFIIKFYLSKLKKIFHL